ncbi:MAG: tetratricopeptide repeat protein [Oceanospirillaceae bacterium]|nr:tetratricopeptide repeat protein [Oceanospirillaceae bacterium]MCP5334840.1 tetratricopeptide repeat protein [Oceanospirillaceae bacterium]MCP5349511.1 tetratricopeptide repeat protein [Oceanospirillaceae bacterium]
MKSVKPFTSVMLMVLLAACATKPAQQVIPDKVPLRETSQYLPQQAYDEQGLKVPYVAEPNPYLEQTGQVAKGSVLLFIEAKKLIAAKDFKTAEQKLSVIADKDKTLAGPLVLLGDIAMQKQEFSAAQDYYQRAIEVNQKNVNAYLGLAEAQRRLGKFTFAQNTYEHALNIWKDFPEAHLNLGILYDLYLNQPAKAQAHYEAYLYLTSYKQSKASEWFAEIKQRTGFNGSYIDLGPQKPKAEGKVAAQQQG